jgi:hypothetical protein
VSAPTRLFTGFLHHLEERGKWRREAVPPPPILDRFYRFLGAERGLRPATIYLYRHFSNKFLLHLHICCTPSLDMQVQVEYGVNRERLLASSRASGILPTPFSHRGASDWKLRRRWCQPAGRSEGLQAGYRSEKAQAPN